MIKTVKFMSQRYLEDIITPRHDIAVISITTPGGEPAKISDQFNSVLRLQFDDLYEETLGEVVGAVPDAAHAGSGYLLWHGLRMPDMWHALAIIDFLNVLTCEHVIVHCHAGVSRSAAIAQFISDKYGAALNPNFSWCDTSCLNKRVYRLLNKHHAGEPTIYGTYVPCEMATVGDKDEGNPWDSVPVL
jgi:predicted protein tyrosine phosphatase